MVPESGVRLINGFAYPSFGCHDDNVLVVHVAMQVFSAMTASQRRIARNLIGWLNDAADSWNSYLVRNAFVFIRGFLMSRRVTRTATRTCYAYPYTFRLSLAILDCAILRRLSRCKGNNSSCKNLVYAGGFASLLQSNFAVKIVLDRGCIAELFLL
jgi:hypothetical protein